MGETTELMCSRCGEEITHHLAEDEETWECEYHDLHAAADAGLEQLVEASILRFVRESGHPGGRIANQLAALIAGRAANEVDVILEVEG